MTRDKQKIRAMKVMKMAIDYYEEMMDKASVDKKMLDDKEMTLLIHCIRQINLSWLRRSGISNGLVLDKITERLSEDLIELVEATSKKRSKDESN